MTTSSPTKPKKKTVAQLKAEQTERLLAALQSARSNGHYPLTISELAQQAEFPATEVLKLLAAKPVQAQVLIAVAKDVDAPLVLVADQDPLLASDMFWQYVAAKVRDKRTQANKPLATDAKKIIAEAGLDKRLKPEAEKALLARIHSQTTPHALQDLLLVKLTPPQIAAKLVEALRQHQQSLPESPLAQLTQLLKSVSLPASDKTVKEALKLAPFVDEAVALDGSLSDKKSPAYLLRSALAIRTPQLVTLAIDAKVQKSQETTLFTAKELAAMLFKAKGATAFADAIEKHCDEHPQLTPALAWLRSKGTRWFFRLQDVEPQPLHAIKSAVISTPTVAPQSEATPPADFATLFDAAFARLDAQQGGRNFLKVYDLRQALAQFPRSDFDAGLRQLRLADRYTMEGASGTLPLSAEERAAGIQEGLLLLIYVSRK